MKTYLFNIIPKLRQFSQELDNTALLTSQHWVVVNEGEAKVTYIFRPSGDLLISQEGEVHKAKWEYLGSQTLLIDRGEKSYLFKHGFFSENVLALRVDGRDEYAVLVSENQFERGMNSIQAVTSFLELALVTPNDKALLPHAVRAKTAPQNDTVILNTSVEDDANTLQILLVFLALVVATIFATVVATNIR